MKIHFFTSLITAIVVLLFASCSFTQQRNGVPDYEYYENDLQNLEQARAAWKILGDVSRKAQWPEAMKQYNESIVRIASHLKNVAKSRKLAPIELDKLPFYIEKSPYASSNKNWHYEQILDASHVDSTYVLEESVMVDGIGVHYIGIAPQNTKAVSELLQDTGNVHTLTGIIDFDRTVNGKPVLRAIPRMLHDSIEVGPHKVRQPLSANFSSSIALFWQLSDAAKTKLLGAFLPEKGLDNMGLYMLEPFDSNKIPVLFTHGLMSNPVTFANLTNRLILDPVIRENFQFWYFGYPSGLPWIVPAKMQREALSAIKETYKGCTNSKTMNNLVMVGHSMGGLITRFNTSTKPWLVLKGMYKVPDGTFEKMTFDNANQILSPLVGGNQKAINRIKSTFVFAPPKGVSRIVFMATPHRGSSFADNWIGRLGQSLISLPNRLLDEATNIVMMSRDSILLSPEKLDDEITSIRQLSPSSSLISHMYELRCPAHIPVHSLIGDRGKGDSPKSSDGIVEYHSSHLDWSTSEKIIPYGHSVQDHPDSALEMRRILREHLVKVKGKQALIENEKGAVSPIWMKNPKRPVIIKRP